MLQQTNVERTSLDTDPSFAVTPNGVCHLQQIVGWLNRIPLIDIELIDI